MIGRPVLELRMRRAWRIAIAIAIPSFTLLIAAGSASILASASDPVGSILVVAVLAATLGGLIVVPGIAVLSRMARGAPDVRIDAQGVVWGNDRSRDLAIDWTEVQTVTSRIQKSRYATDRLFVLQPRADRTGTPPRTLYGQLMALANRVMSGSRFAISTMVVDHPWDEVQAAIEAHLGRPVQGG